MDTRKFRRLMLIWLGILVVFVVSFPFLLFGIVKVSTCAKITGACGAVAAGSGMIIKPIGIVVISVAIGWIALQRIRWLNLSFAWFGAVVLWLFGSAEFLIGFGNFWGANLGIGLTFVSLPFLFLFLLTFLVFLYIGRDRDQFHNTNVAQLIAALAVVHALLLMWNKPIIALQIIPVISTKLNAIIAENVSAIRHMIATVTLGFPITAWLWIDLAIFIIALAYILLSRQSGASIAHRAV